MEKEKTDRTGYTKTLTVAKGASEKVELVFVSSLKAVLKASRKLMAVLGISGSVLVGLLIILIMLGSAILFFSEARVQNIHLSVWKFSNMIS